MTLFDPHSPAFAEDPYPFYARLLAEGPVHFVPSVGMWWVVSHEAVKTVLQDRRFGKQMPPDPVPSNPSPSNPSPSSPETQTREGPPRLPPEFQKLAELPPMMLMTDPPDHTRLRALVSKAFTPRVVESLRPRITAIAGVLLDEAAAAGEMDLVADFAFTLPAKVIAELLGVPVEDHGRFRDWSTRLVRGADATQPPEARMDGMRAQVELMEYFEDLVARRRGGTGTDLIAQLIAAEAEGERLSHGEILSMCILLLVAGHETTTNLIGSGMLALLQHPGQAARLRQQPEGMERAVEELLRYVSPVQRMFYVAQAELELAGTPLKPRDRVSVVLGAANRDPAVFRHPDRLDLTRRENPHLAFGRGIHFCLGAPLARLEAEIAFGLLLERFPGMRVVDPGPRWLPNTFIRGLEHLPVRW